MKFRYGNVVLGVAATLCLSTMAFAGGPGEEETTEETATAAPAPAAAVEEEGPTLGDWIPGTFSGSVTAISDYSFRGISQTQTGFAGQAGVTWKQDCGFYVGAWGSSLHYGGTDDAYWEQDLLVGYTNTFGDFTLDVSGTALVYPKASKYTYFEIAAKGAYNVADIFSIKAGVIYSPDYFGILDNAGYFSTGFSYPIPIPENRFAALTLDANFGYTVSEQFINGPVGGTTNNYLDWNAGLIVAVHKNLSFDLRYVDTDIGRTYGSTSDARFIGGATFSF